MKERQQRDSKRGSYFSQRHGNIIRKVTGDDEGPADKEKEAGRTKVIENAVTYAHLSNVQR